MCADSNLVMSISLFTMTATAVTMTMTAVIAVVAMATVIGTVIGTENTSSLKSKAYRAGHSGHRKLQFSLIIKKYTDNESIKKKKVGNYYDHYDHPPGTLAGVGFSAFYTCDCYCAHCDHRRGQFCLLSTPDETAPETSVLKIPSSEAIQNHSPGAENGIGLSGSEDHRGRSGGRGDTVRIRYIFGKREFCEGSAQRDRSPNR